IIIGRAEVIAVDLEDPEIRRQIDVIIQAALDATQTVKRIQEFTRVRRSRDFRAVDVRQLIDEMLEMTRSRWKDEAEGRGVHYDIVARHGGEVDVQSRLGAGTTFTIRLPVATRLVESKAGVTAVPVARSARVLVVDDEVEILSAVGDLLRHDGHVATLCSDP